MGIAMIGITTTADETTKCNAVTIKCNAVTIKGTVVMIIVIITLMHAEMNVELVLTTNSAAEVAFRLNTVIINM